MLLTKLIQRSAVDPKYMQIARRWADALSSLFGDSSVAEAGSELVDPFPALTDVVLDRAYMLAAYILGDVEAAKKVALEVASSMEVPHQLRKEVSVADGKKPRLYKVNEPSLALDQLIYKRTWVQERLQETQNPGQLDAETMTIRFVKSIMEYSINHNSLYMTVGFYRVLMNYPVQNARRIYQQLVHSPDETKPSADYIRHLKVRIFEKLEGRYKSFIETGTSGDQGELRFKKHPDSSDSYPLVRQTLDLMTPTLSACPLSPESLKNSDSLRASLYPLPINEGNEDENQLERIRMHMLTHHSCFARLLALLDIDSPEQFLEVPWFKLKEDGGSSGPRPFDRQYIPPLSADDKKKIRAELGKRHRRLEKMRPEKVSVVIDNVERATLNLNESRPSYIEVEEGAGLIEFRGSDKEGTLSAGILPLRWDDSITADEPTTYRLPMRGREVKFTVTYTSDAEGLLTGAKVVCSYAKVPQLFVTPSQVIRVFKWLAQLPSSVALLPRMNRRGLAACGLLVLGTVSYLMYKQRANDYACQIKPIELETPVPGLVEPPQFAALGIPAIVAHEPYPVADAQGQSAMTMQEGVRDQNLLPVIRETVTVKVDDSLLRHYAEPPRTTLSHGTDKPVTIVSGQHSPLPDGTKVITLPVTDRRFIRFSELARAGNSANIDPSPLLKAKSFYVKPFAASRLSQDLYEHLISALVEDNYTISTDKSKAEAILEGRLTENAGGVTLKLLLNSNNTDGNVIWLKTVSMQDKEGNFARTAAGLSEKAVKSLQGERKEDVYVALDFFLAHTAGVSGANASKMLPAYSAETLHAQLGGQVAVWVVIDNFLRQAKEDKRINKTLAEVDLLQLGPHIAQMIAAVNAGSSTYRGLNIKTLMPGVKINEKEFGFLLEDLAATFDKLNVVEKEKREVLAIVESYRTQIVTDAPTAKTLRVN